MQSALNQFHISIRRVRDLVAIYQSISSQATNALDLSDILRAALVLSVSALDYYVHEVVKLGMLEIAQGERPEPSAFGKFQVSLGNARQGIISNSWLADEIQQKHSYKSFQQPDNIADAIRLISDKKLWEEVGRLMDTNPQDIKRELSLIVGRRNKIAHEADIDPTLGLGDRWNIDELSISNAINFIERVVESIHSILQHN